MGGTRDEEEGGGGGRGGGVDGACREFSVFVVKRVNKTIGIHTFLFASHPTSQERLVLNSITVRLSLIMIARVPE